MPTTSTRNLTRQTVTRRIRWAREYLAHYLRRAPLTSFLLVAGIVALAIQLILGPHQTADLAFTPGNYSSTWEPLTGVLVYPKPAASATFLILLALIGPLVERTLGSWRFALTAAASYLAPAVALTILFSVAEGSLPGWASNLAGHSVFGLPLVLIGSLMASTRSFPTIWRRRTRILIIITTLVLLGFGGSLQDVGLLLAALTGWACGVFLSPAPHREHSLVGTRHEARTLVALSITAVSLGIFFAAHAPNPIGPLAAARFDISSAALADSTLDTVCATDSLSTLCAHQVYLAQTRGLLPSLLALLPLILQLVLALGLARGRRVAYLGTLALQGTVLVFTSVRLALFSGIFGSPTLSGQVEHLEDAGARLLVPVLIPAALLALTISTRRYFTLTSNRALHRAAWRALTLVGLTGAAVTVALAFLLPQGYAPQAQPLSLLGDYLTKLLPSTAWYVLPPSYTSTFWVTTALTWLLPAVFWLTTLIYTYRLVLQPAGETDENRDRFTNLVRTRGAGTLGWIATWDNRRYWISPSGQEGFAYIEHGGVALTVGDPAAAPEKVESAVREFAAYCTAQGLAPALYSVHSPAATAARALGWSSWQVAEEAVIDLADLKFSGKKFQSVRTALNQAGKQGITAKWTTYNTLLLAEWTQIVEISEGWVSDKALPEMGFTLGGLEELKDPETRILLAIDESGFIHGVTSWMPVHRRGQIVGLTLDFMRRREGDTVFPASMEFLIASAAQSAKEEGLELLSLSGAPLAQADPMTDRAGLDRLLDYLGERMEPLYGFRSLLSFKAKFRPAFDPMYLVTPDSGDLAAIGLTVTHAYLPEMKAKDVLGMLSAMGSAGTARKKEK